MKLKKYKGLGINDGDYLYVFDEVGITLHIHQDITKISYGKSQVNTINSCWEKVNNLVPLSVVYKLILLLQKRKEYTMQEELFDDIGLIERLQHEQEEIQEDDVSASPYEDEDNPKAENFDSTCWLD